MFSSLVLVRLFIIISNLALYLNAFSLDNSFYRFVIGFIIILLLMSITLVIMRIFVNKVKSNKIDILPICTLIIQLLLLLYWAFVSLGYIPNNTNPYCFLVTVVVNDISMLFGIFNISFDFSFSSFPFIKKISFFSPASVSLIDKSFNLRSLSKEGISNVKLTLPVVCKGKQDILPDRLTIGSFILKFIQVPYIILPILETGTEKKCVLGALNTDPRRSPEYIHTTHVENIRNHPQLSPPRPVLNNSSDHSNFMASIISTETSITAGPANTTRHDNNQPNNTNIEIDTNPVVSTIIQPHEL